MSDWIDFSRWPECQSMQRPGYVFELANAEGKTLLMRCAPDAPRPAGWSTGPIRFRLVPEQPPRHSAPAPKPRGE